MYLSPTMALFLLGSKIGRHLALVGLEQGIYLSQYFSDYIVSYIFHAIQVEVFCFYYYEIVLNCLVNF